MANPYQNDPTPIKFACESCHDENAFWGVAPETLFHEPSRKMKEGNREHKITTAQCSLCGETNTIYWYKGKLSS